MSYSDDTARELYGLTEPHYRSEAKSFPWWKVTQYIPGEPGRTVNWFTSRRAADEYAANSSVFVKVEGQTQQEYDAAWIV